MGTPTIYLEQKKSEKECIPLSEPQSFYIYKSLVYKVVRITRACFHDRAVFKKILPSNLI